MDALAICLEFHPSAIELMDQMLLDLARGMELSGLDQLWVADITYIHLAEDFGYLAIVLDAFSRKVVGWAFETHLQAVLAIAALEQAIALFDSGFPMTSIAKAVGE